MKVVIVLTHYLLHRPSPHKVLPIASKASVACLGTQKIKVIVFIKSLNVTFTVPKQSLERSKCHPYSEKSDIKISICIRIQGIN